MAIQNQSSFIPKDGSFKKPRRESMMGILMLVSLVVLGLSLLLFAGSYGYWYLLDRQVNAPCDGEGGACGLKATVDNIKHELDLKQIVRYNRLDKKMKVAQGLIDGHTTLVPLFDVLERLTIHNVRYNKFSVEDGATVTIEGTAREYEDLAAQLRVYKDSNSIKEAVFSGLGLDDDSLITFKLQLVPVSSLLTFSTNLNN
jgi:hypothetical protein